ncbi:hypothetical protein INT47_008167 [Mucor saturninus]|uniref:Uncharacterized protein n=1 Tax=Mucor saturninus TaxID=64648 RepID=A0A8H7UXV0_9FUNG|nr:hypothetical protein INT47_008167 [Mucor saturninus]
MYQESAATPAPIENSSDMDIQDCQATSGPSGLSGFSGLSGTDATQTQKGNVGPIIKNNSPTSDELDEDSELIKLYQNRIKQLHKAQLMSDDLDTLKKTTNSSPN